MKNFINWVFFSYSISFHHNPKPNFHQINNFMDSALSSEEKFYKAISPIYKNLSSVAFSSNRCL